MKIIKVRARKAFSPTKIPGARWVINQYIGCQHACKYCYAKFMCKWYDYGRWGSWVIVRENIPDLVRSKYVIGKVYMSSVSDPYQPIEEDFELTKKILENMNKRIKISILTKSDLVLRDVELFKRFKNIEVGLTVNGFEKSVKNDLEPYSPSIERRINALKRLYESGIKNYAFISPIIPKLTDIEKIISDTRDFVAYHFFEFLNFRAAGARFRGLLRNRYWEAYEVMSNKDKFERYVKDTIEIIRKSGVKIGGICLHYPEFIVLK
ncbi:MAG: radical SAM protein [Thaumarchaeota archaeon]|nr:MAG: radical SAM protein [Nitrososphaerota archaeon]